MYQPRVTFLIHKAYCLPPLLKFCNEYYFPQSKLQTLYTKSYPNVTSLISYLTSLYFDHFVLAILFSFLKYSREAFTCCSLGLKWSTRMVNSLTFFKCLLKCHFLSMSSKLTTLFKPQTKPIISTSLRNLYSPQSAPNYLFSTLLTIHLSYNPLLILLFTVCQWLFKCKIYK